MPQYLGYKELEFDATEARGGGRLPQGTPRSRYTGLAAYYPDGLHPNLVRHKKEKTLNAVGTPFTRVTRTTLDQV